jgi:hypothetical protein
MAYPLGDFKFVYKHALHDHKALLIALSAVHSLFP